MHTRSLWAPAIGAMLITSACDKPASPPSADVRLQAIYRDEWAWREQQFPDNEDAQKSIQDHLPKVDVANQEKRLSKWQVLGFVLALPAIYLLSI